MGRWGWSASVLAISFLAACSDGGEGVDAGLDLSAATDLASSDLAGADLRKGGVDLAGVDFAGIGCGSQLCSGGQICCVAPDVTSQGVNDSCVAASGCGDGGIPAGCDGPEDCGGATAICCGDLVVASGGMSVSGAASCTGTCSGSATASLGSGVATLTTKLCHGAADCSGYTGTTPVSGVRPFDRCCGYPGASIRFCAPSVSTAVLGNAVTCD